MGLNLEQTLAWTKSVAATSPSASAELAMLNDLQGNILKGHGRHFTSNIFLKFDASKKAAAKKYLAVLAKDVDTALDQLTATQVFKASGHDAGTFVALMFTAKGYDALGEAAAKPRGAAFNAGMKTRPLEDPPASKWDTAFKGDIHAMLLVAASTAKLRNAEAAAYIAAIKATGAITVLGTEEGNAVINDDGNGIEHFGYVDGRSQPLMLQEDVDKEAANGGIDQWDPSIKLSQVLARCPGGRLAVSHGSYFVFRKLEQDVKGFKTREAKLAKELRLEAEDEERAGASVVGRFENGTPVSLSATEVPFNPAQGVANNFNFATDPAGLKCPFAGHIRKSNPRNDTSDSKDHLMARRGIPFGARTDGPNDGKLTNKPSGGVGLLFMAYQSDLENQFEFTQRFWVNNANFKTAGVGIDPLIGQPAGAAAQQWPDVYGKSLSAPLDFSGFVTMKGGEYFFAPSLSYLLNLAQ
jgi:Dyp-type peroxidase family